MRNTRAVIISCALEVSLCLAPAASFAASAKGKPVVAASNARRQLSKKVQRRSPGDKAFASARHAIGERVGMAVTIAGTAFMSLPIMSYLGMGTGTKIGTLALSAPLVIGLAVGEFNTNLKGPRSNAIRQLAKSDHASLIDRNTQADMLKLYAPELLSN